SINKLIDYIENQILIDTLDRSEFPQERISAGLKIAERLQGKSTIQVKPRATVKNGSINISLQKEIFDDVQKLLDDGHYFNAVEESYKIVRQKLKSITGKEKAHEAFAESNLEKIFGHFPQDEPEKDFFDGVKFLHMSIQFLRNEKAHIPAQDMDKTLAIH